MSWREVLGVATAAHEPHEQNPQYPQKPLPTANYADCADIAEGVSTASERVGEPRNEAEADDFDEHAAIVEFDGEIPRAWAEGFARLDPNRPPAGVTLQHWQAVLDGIGAFLDRWATEAIVKGWQAADIFGADATHPEVSWLNSGPLWHGDGARVVEVHPDRIVFETTGGARQTAPRRPHMGARVLPWELGE